MSPATAPAVPAAPAPSRRGRRLAVAAALAAVAAVALLAWATREPPPEPAVVADETVEPLPLDAGATAGTLTPDDAPAPDGRTLDAWAFSTDSDEPLTFTAAAAFTPTLAVRDPEGAVHEGRPDSADAHVARLAGLRGKGRYVVTVSSRTAGATGRYVLTVEQEPVPFELVPDGQPRPGTLGERGRALRDGRYEDRHAVEARRGQPYLVILEADSNFAHVVVRSPEGDSLTRDVSYERLRTPRGTYASVARFVPRYPGRYLVGVASDAPGGVGEYALALKTRTEPVVIGREAVRGVLGLVSERRGEHYVDVFTFAGQGGRAVAFEVRTAGFTLALIGPEGEPLGSGPTVGLVLPYDGRYRLEVTSERPRATGAYDLVPALPPVPPPPPDTTSGKPPPEREPGRDGRRK